MTTPNNNNNNNNIPWIEKYRPYDLSSIISNNNIVKTLNALDRNHFIPNMIYYGPSGSGKTSTILAFCRHIYDIKEHQTLPSYDLVLELNASEQRNINELQVIIYHFVENRRFQKGKKNRYKKKMIIMDEADSLTMKMQEYIIDVMNTYKYVVTFCFLCNHINNLSAAIQSRCVKCIFIPIEKMHVQRYIKRICDKEKMNINPKAMNALVHISKGDLRRCLNNMQMLHAHVAHGEMIVEKDVYRISNLPNPDEITHIIDTIRLKKYKTNRGLHRYIYDFLYTHALSPLTVIYYCYDYIKRHFDVVDPDILHMLASLEEKCWIRNLKTNELNVANLVSNLQSFFSSLPSKTKPKNNKIGDGDET